MNGITDELIGFCSRHFRYFRNWV